MPTSPGRVSSLPVHPHPEVDLDQFRLHIDGLVDRPLSLSLADLRSMPQTHLDGDFACLEGWVAPGLEWEGVALVDVLAVAGVQPGARWVQASFEGFSVPLALDDAHAALLALTLDGQPLTVAHGAPVRLVVTGGECFTSVKWLAHLELRTDPAPNTAGMIATGRLAPPTNA